MLEFDPVRMHSESTALSSSRPLELHNDPMVVIFQKLPSKTLTRFRSLSKEWNKILTSPAFCKDHYNYITGTVGRSKAGANYLFIYSFSDRKVLVHYGINESKTAPRCVQFPIQSDRYGIGLCTNSACHGMLCIPYVDFHADLEGILIWNPVTGYSRQVPTWPRRIENTDVLTHIGFGYDDATDDYKIVVRTREANASGDQRTYVLSLKSDNDVWRNITDQNHPPVSWGSCKSNPVPVGGDIYWISRIKNSSMEQKLALLKFNVAAEKVTIMPCPSDVDEDKWNVELCLYKGSLCFCSSFKLWPCEFRTPRWRFSTLIQDEGGKAVWKSLMDVPYLPFLRKCGELNACGFTESGDLIICTMNGIIVYLPGENRFVMRLLYDRTTPRFNRRGALYLLQAETLMSPF